jgi:tellurite resistance protein
MALWDKLTNSGGEAPLTKQEGIVAVMLAIAAADGHISDEEIEDLISRLRRLQLFSGLTDDQLIAAANKPFDLLRKGGPDELIRSASPALPQQLRESAFAIAVDLAFSDGSVADEEKQLIEKLQHEFGISDEIATQTVNVMITKNSA